MNFLEPNQKTPIDILLKPVDNLLKNKASSGVLLFLAVIAALVWVNFIDADSYHHLWENTIGFTIGSFSIEKSLHYWINDGLMTIFFFTVGLEIKREIMAGDLSSPKKAALPIAAAIGGMAFPALIYLAFNNGTPSESGWGVPMATDIAFSLGVLSLLGKRVPLALKVFLTALAIVDDLGAVLVIAFCYTENLYINYLEWGGLFFALLVIGNLIGIRKSGFYIIIGTCGLWIAFLLSGVHATLAGVLIAAAIPARVKIDEGFFLKKLHFLIDKFKHAKRTDSSFVTEEQQDILEQIKNTRAMAETPLQKMEFALNPIVAYLILPIFALSNAGLEINADILGSLFSEVSLGIGMGLILGKTIGIVLLSYLLVKLKVAFLPPNTSWLQMIGIGLMAGIGFTMSIFIAELAFEDALLKEQAKMAILVASLLSGLSGYLVLRFSGNGKKKG